MKTLFTILSVFIFSLSSFAFPYQSRLSISTSDNSFLRIIMMAGTTAREAPY